MNVIETNSELWIRDVERHTLQLQADLLRYRRHLHTYPELSLKEFGTTRFLAGVLRDEGLSPQLLKEEIGLVCDIDWARKEQPEAPVKRIGIRADIDALPIQTALQCSYASKEPGVMHACGHDAHTTMALGATLIIARLAQENKLPWPVHTRTLFQPAEEIARGGLLLIEQGHISDLANVLALHVDPMLAVGHIATRRGAITAGCMMFEVNIRGTSGHSARPHLAEDALEAGTRFISEAYQLAPRVHDCRDAAVINFGTFHAGTAGNVVADCAKITGTLRTLSEDGRIAIFDRLNRIASAVSLTTGCKVQVNLIDFTPSLINNARLASEVLLLAEQLPRVELATELPMPSMGAEDFAFIAAKVPSCLIRIGTSSRDGQRFRYPLHSASFDIDENALSIGAQLLASVAVFACRPTVSTDDR